MQGRDQGNVPEEVSFINTQHSGRYARPKLYITTEAIDAGKKGLYFRVYNLGKSAAHSTLATIKILDYDLETIQDAKRFIESGGKILMGEWHLPWKICSLETTPPEQKEGCLDYGAKTIFPNQTADLAGFEMAPTAHEQEVLGLYALPYKPNSPFWPQLYWKLNENDNLAAPLKPNHEYTVQISLFCEELTRTTRKTTVISWNGKRLNPIPILLEWEFRINSALHNRIIDKTGKSEESLLKSYKREMLRANRPNRLRKK
ncbi:hypothetical protein ApAK_07375 [Thermoplasmatales archaeon AK]|nr:hypothetical protein [Thermoplasmatales archaeon AK]